MSAGLAVPITTSGRPGICAHPSAVTAKAARLHTMTTGRAQVRDSIPGNLQARAVAVRRARDRYQAAGLPDFLRIVRQAEHVEEQDPDSDVDVRVDHQAIAVRLECDAVLPDRRPVPQGVKAQITSGRGVSAGGGERPQ
jgi:hypothetical protein